FEPARASSGLLIHGGCFSPDLTEFLFTVSDAEFQRFDVMLIRRVGAGWSEPEPAFFSSSFNEHGVSFSPGGEVLYFCSTRPVNHTQVAPTWHLWRCEREGDEWGAPIYVDIPNLRHKLASHPSLAADGTLYFHAGNPDYSLLQIYRAKPDGQGFHAAEPLSAAINQGRQQATPLIDPEQRFLLYEDTNGLMLSHRSPQGDWSPAMPLGVRSPLPSRGNPYLTPDGRFLFFAAGEDPGSSRTDAWQIYWVRSDGLLPSQP
ncbi:MAG: hypothetical protein ACI82F_003154, partial [Planctomycetota bacterium]